MTEKLMTKEFRRIAVKSHLFVINISVSRLQTIDAAAFGTECGQREYFTPQFITRPSTESERGG
jgi:hypothetical protein